MKSYISQTLCEAHDSTKEFWKAFKLPWCLGWPDSRYEGRQLAAHLMKEEFNELLEADTKEKKLDACCDLLYVTAGAMHSVGYNRQLYFQPFFNENFAGPLAEAIRLIQEPGIVCHRRLECALPEATYGIVVAAFKEFPKFRGAFGAVHTANMSKLWDEKPDDLQGRTAERVIGGKWLVKRKEDGKVIKSPEFKHPDLAPYL